MLSVQQDISFEGSPENNIARLATHRAAKRKTLADNEKQNKAKQKACENAVVVNKFDFVGVAG
jgi:hypothetical protein